MAPALVRAGLLGKVEWVSGENWRAVWTDAEGLEGSAVTAAHGEAVTMVARNAHGGLRFHDLRHSYVTWLVSNGVLVNDVQRVMGHEQASTTLNRYAHVSGRQVDQVRDVFADFLLTSSPDNG